MDGLMIVCLIKNKYWYYIALCSIGVEAPQWSYGPRNSKLGIDFRDCAYMLGV